MTFITVKYRGETTIHQPLLINHLYRQPREAGEYKLRGASIAGVLEEIM